MIDYLYIDKFSIYIRDLRFYNLSNFFSTNNKIKCYKDKLNVIKTNVKKATMAHFLLLKFTCHN